MTGEENLNSAKEVKEINKTVKKFMILVENTILKPGESKVENSHKCEDFFEAMPLL